MTGIPNTSPVLRGVPRGDTATVSAANTARDGTGTVVTVLTAGTNFGSVVDLITIEAQVATTAGVIRLFVHNGSAFFLWKEILVTAITPSTTLAAFRTEVSRSDGLPVLVLPAGYSLRASTHNAEAQTIHCQAWDL